MTFAIEQSYDVRLVEWAARKSVDPTNAVGDSGQPIVAVVNLPPNLGTAANHSEEHHTELVKSIRWHLANGRPVVVRGSELEDKWHWDEKTALKIAGPLSSPIVWQGTSIQYCGISSLVADF